MTKLRWGILSAAILRVIIGNPFMTAAIWSSWPWASRSLERSRKFIEECQAKRPFDIPSIPAWQFTKNCSRLKNVDAVYISLADRTAQALGAARRRRRKARAMRKSRVASVPKTSRK